MSHYIDFWFSGEIPIIVLLFSMSMITIIDYDFPMHDPSQLKLFKNEINEIVNFKKKLTWEDMKISYSQEIFHHLSPSFSSD